MQGPWERYGGVGATPPAGTVVGTPRPQRPPAQTPTNAAIDEENLRRLRLENEQRVREAAAGTTAAASVTEGERKASSFLTRALGANIAYERTGVGPRSIVGQNVADIAPNVLNTLPLPLGNSPERQVSDSAQDEFIAASLRQDSGAAIPPEEMERQRRIYFPMPGDGPEATAQKRAARRRAIEGLVNSSGRGLTPQQRQEVDAWMAASDGGEAPPPDLPAIGPDPQGAAPSERPTATQQQTLEPTLGDRVALSEGGFRSENDPVLAGVNARVNAMLKQGASAQDFAAFYRDVGIPLNEVMPQTLRVIQWRGQNPNYQGDFNVNIDDRLIPMSGTRQLVNVASQSPIGAAGIAAGNVVTGNRLDNLAELTGGSGELANIGMEAVREQHPYASLAGDIAGGASLYGAGRAVASRLPGLGGAPATRTFAPAAIAGDAAMGGYIGSGMEGTDPFSAEGAVTGAAFGAGGGVAGRGTINTLGRTVSPTGGALAPAYAEGVQPTIGQRMGGVFDRAEQAFASVPLVGGVQRGARNRAVEQFQAGAFNQALREIGTELPGGIRSGRPAHRFAQRAFNREFNQARAAMQFAPDPDFSTAFANITNDVSVLPMDSQRAFDRIVRSELGGRLRGRGGTLTGDDYVRTVSRIEQRSRSIRGNRAGDQQLADALDALTDALDDGAARQSPAAAVERLARARRGYARLVVIENASRRRGGPPAEFTPTQFDAAVQDVSGGVRSRRYLAGDALMQDYAAAGQRLGGTVPDSGTPERIMTLGGLAGLAHFIDPATLMPWAANTAANLPGIRQGVNAALAPNRQALDPVREALMRRSYLGSLLAAPAAAGGQ